MRESIEKQKNAWIYRSLIRNLLTDWDTIPQLLPARGLRLFVFAVWLFKGKSKYITKHLMYGPSGN